MFLFVLLYVLSFFFVFGFDSWLIVWMGLEVNMISFVLLMFRHNNIVNVESCMKYFFIQATGSAMLVFMWMGNFMEVNLFLLVLGYSLGAGPFFFWLPGVVDGVDWIIIFMLLGFQKILPLMLMSMLMSDVVLMLSLVSLFVGCYGMFNQVALKGLMVYSSIHHLGWMMVLMYVVEDYWVVYLVMYMVMVFPLMLYFNKFNMIGINELVIVEDKFILCVGVLSLAGIPPMLGFFLKMWAFKLLINVSMYMFMLMVILSVIMAYVYIKMLYSIILWEVDVNMMVKVGGVESLIMVVWSYGISMVVGGVFIYI